MAEMNEKTKLLFDLIENKDNDEKNREKIEKLFQASNIEKEAGLPTKIETLAVIEISHSLLKSFDYTYIGYAALHNRSDILSLLLEECAIIPLDKHYAVTHKNTDSSTIQGHTYVMKTPLAIAAENNYDKIVKLLLFAGAAYESYGSSSQTPLQRAEKNSKSYFILKAFKNLTIAEKSYEQQDSIGVYAKLFSACKHDTDFVIEYLSNKLDKLIEQNIEYKPILKFIQLLMDCLRDPLLICDKNKGYKTKIQEELLPKFFRYEADKPENTLFKSSKEKRELLLPLIQGASYDWTYSLMQGNNNCLKEKIKEERNEASIRRSKSETNLHALHHSTHFQINGGNKLTPIDAELAKKINNITANSQRC